jgi:hypothetical protein
LCGEADTVVVTSQDARASRLLGGRTARVNGDVMEPEEAVCVVLNHFDDFVNQDEDGECKELIEEVAKNLDRLALAMDLAGARISANVEDGDGFLKVVLRQYLADYWLNRDRPLRDEQFASVSPYETTVWTAWETGLASLRKLGESQTDICLVHLLDFMTLLDRSNVQDELFRLASFGLEKACSRLAVEVPAWMRGLLTNWEDGEWNSFSYRTTIDRLTRYGLVRPVAGRWKNVAMHSLVQWRAGLEMDRGKYLRLYLAFIAAVCENSTEEKNHALLRRRVVAHLRRNDMILGGWYLIEPEGLRWMWVTTGTTLRDSGMWKEAEDVF